MYRYQENKQHIFTDKGQREFLKVRDRVMKLLDEAGAFKMFSALKGVTGDTWTMMAYVDRLVELDEIKEITENMNVSGQDRVFVKSNEER